MSILATGCKALVIMSALVVLAASCAPSQPMQQEQGSSAKPADGKHHFVVLDPGHFHAALVLKPSGYEGVSDLVGIYAPVGEDFTDHMARVVPFNTREDDPASWRYHICLGSNFEEVMLEEKFGDIAILSGRNQPKIDRILSCIQGGINVLADKPWVIEKAKLPVLEEVIAAARGNGKIAYDIMTGRHDMSTHIQGEIIGDEAVFGTITQGTPDDPAVVKESVHHLYKLVAGLPNKRPWWFFDTSVQGEGLVDVTTHLVDMIFWVLFPGEAIDVERDIEMNSASHWPTVLNTQQFSRITGKQQFPPQLGLNAEGKLEYYCNGQMNFAVKGVNCRVQVVWNYEAPAGTGDTHFSVVKGDKAHVLILQGKEQKFKPELYVQLVPGADKAAVGKALETLMTKLSASHYPGISAVAEVNNRWHIVVPEDVLVQHESQFDKVTQDFLGYLDGKHALPDWEYPNLYAKYYVTTSALELARQAK
ncbi:putative oxidoreductase C-terminal domain-containing protein [Gemmatimonadota bacterium]